MKKMKMDLIGASAGSGKTWRLTEELSKSIEKDGVAPEQVIAVTFTRAAAAELKERVRARLFEGGLTEAAHRMEGALVGTVHSVCERILKRFAFEAGMSPDFQVMPEEESAIFFKSSISSILKGRDLRRYNAAMDRFGERYGERMDAARKIADLARANRVSPDSLRAMARENIDSYFALLPKPATGRGGDAAQPLIQELERVISAIGGNIEKGFDTTGVTAGYLDKIKTIHTGAKAGTMTWKDWALLQNERPGAKSRDLCENLSAMAARHLSDPLLREDIEVCAQTVFDIAAGALGAYDAWKKERGLIDFTDMEEKVHDLLGEEYVAATMADEYRLLMVDEFQDTSPIQLALFNRLGSAVGRMVWVGDKKQCIYGFRASDPELMDAAYNAVSRGAEKSYLKDSYRSRPGLVDFANAIFVKTFGELGHSKDEVELAPKRKENKDLSPPIEIWQMAGTNIKTDAVIMARGIALLLGANDPLVIEDKITGKVRPARPGDIAVLRRGNKGCVEMAVELGKLGIRASVSRNGLISTLEGMYLQSACEIVLDRGASLPAAVLLHIRSGGSPEALIDERLRLNLSEKKDRTKEYPWAVEPVLESLRGLSDHLEYLSPSEMLDRIIEASGLRGLCLGWSGPEFRLGNVEMFRAYARQYEESCGFRNSGASFLGLYLYLTSLPDGGSQSAVSSPDSVNVMTYHKAKGLEWPVVILGDLDKKLEGLHNAPFSTEPKAFSSVKAFDFNNPLKGRVIRYWPWPYESMESKAPLWEPIKDSALDREFVGQYIREEQRLMYVGLTRARDVLVLPVRRTEKKSMPSPKRLEFLNAGIALPVDEPEGVKDCDFNLGKKFNTRMRYINESTEVPELSAAGTNWFAHPEGEAPVYRELYIGASWIENVPGAQVVSEHSIGGRVTGTFKGEEDDPSFGNAVHAFYAADSKELPMEERLALAQNILAAHEVSGVMTPEALVETSERLNAHIASTWPESVVLKELPIKLKRDGQIIMGVADMVVETEKELHLIDHKTFPGNAEQCKKRAVEYSGQLDAYAEALEKATGKKCATRVIHYPVGGMVVGVG